MKGSAGSTSVVEEISRRPGEKQVTARVKEEKNAYAFLTFHVLRTFVYFSGEC